jgi:RimK family alpha-L-glutamate ligase
MHIVLITTKGALEENARIREEITNLGHEFLLLDLKEFEYEISGDKIKVPEFESLNPDLIIMRGVFNSIKSICAYTEGLKRKGVKVFDNNFLTHKYSINKIADSVKLTMAGIPIPDTYHYHSFDKFLPCAERIGYPIVCKLTRTGKGAGVYKYDSQSDFARYIEKLKGWESEARNFLLQKFVDYQYDLRVLIIGEEMFCMRRIPGKGEFRANFSLGGSVELFDLDEDGKQLARRALNAVEVKVGGVDLLIAKDGKRYILEVNHTPGMLGMEKATGINITRKYVEYAIKNAE